MAEWHAAYVLLRIGTADAANIRQRLVNLPGVNLAHTLLGPDDLICYIEAEGIRGYNKVLNAEIRPLIDEGLLQRSETIPVLSERFEGYPGRDFLPVREACWTLINCSVGNVTSVVETLRTIRGVKNAHAVLGRYDLVAYVEADTWKELLVAINHVRRTPGISRTDSRIALLATN